MGLLDWFVLKMDSIAKKAKERSDFKEAQRKREQEAYMTAFNEARVEYVAEEARKDAMYGGHFKRIVATGLHSIKQRIDENKKKRKKSNAMSINTPIVAKVK